MEQFNNENRSQINVAIVGAVSAGKSTLLNTIFAETYSDCKIKRTTMSPQVYYEVDKKRDSKIIKEIKANNTEVNKKIEGKRDNGEEITMDDIKEVAYVVPKVYGFSKWKRILILQFSTFLVLMMFAQRICISSILTITFISLIL